MRKILTRNAAQCLECGDVIESKHRHDFVSCSCSNIFIDGGLDYIRMGVRNPEAYLDLSERAE